MTYRKLGALVTVGAIALAFATNEAIAQAGGAGVVAAPQAGATVPGAHAFNRGVGGYFWPGYGFTLPLTTCPGTGRIAFLQM